METDNGQPARSRALRQAVIAQIRDTRRLIDPELLAYARLTIAQQIGPRDEAGQKRRGQAQGNQMPDSQAADTQMPDSRFASGALSPSSLSGSSSPLSSSSASSSASPYLSSFPPRSLFSSSDAEDEVLPIDRQKNMVTILRFLELAGENKPLGRRVQALVSDRL